MFKKHLSLWKQSCQAIFSFTIFTAVSLSYANEAADEAFLQGGLCWDQLHLGDFVPASACRQDLGRGGPVEMLPEQLPRPGTHDFLPDKAPRSYFCHRRALVLYFQRPKCQLSLAQASVPSSSIAGAP